MANDDPFYQDPHATWEQIDRLGFSPYDPTNGMGGGLGDSDGLGTVFPDGEYHSDELEYQNPMRAAMGAALMNLGMPRNQRNAMAVVNAVRGARAHNTRMRRMQEPKYQMVNGRLMKFGPRGQFLGEVQDFREPNRNDITMGNQILRPNAQTGGYDPVYQGQSAPQDKYSHYANIDNNLIGVTPGGVPDTLFTSPGSGTGPEGLDVKDIASLTNTLRDDLRSATAGYEGALETYPMAMELGNIYANSKSSKADRAAADRGLVNLSVKLWDPTSAVLSGEYATVAEAQAEFDKLMTRIDLTSGATLGDETRKSLLKMIHQSAQYKIEGLTERYQDYIGRAEKLVGAENLDLVVPARVLSEGKLKSNLYDMTRFQPAMKWAGIKWEPVKVPELNTGQLQQIDNAIGE